MSEPHTTRSAHQALVPIHLRIAELRQRIRRQFLLDGLLRLVAVALGLIVASFVLDRLLDLPRGVRAVYLVAALVVLAVVVVRRIVRPLSVRLDDQELALAVEARWPELKDRVISALQFVRQIEDPDNEESVELMEAVLAETAELARQRRFDALVSSRGLRLVGAVGLGLLLTSGITTAVRPDLAGIWARRALLSSVEWPRATTLVVVDLSTDEPLVLTRGDDLSVVVEARGEVPDDVRIVYRPLEGDDTEDSRRMFRLPDTKNRFQFEFREIPQSFEFTVIGGDDDDGDPVYVVRALVAPAVESIRAHCTFPDYTNRPPETISLGDFEVPIGTRVQFAIDTNMLVQSAHFVREGTEGKPLEFRAAGSYGLSFVVEQSFQYAIALVGPEGQRNRVERDTYRITAVPDRRPEVRLLSPTSRELFSPAALIPLKVLATDNYGVAELRLLHRFGREEARESRDVRNASDLGSREVVAFDPLEVASLRGPEGRSPKEGDLLGLEVVALDNNGLEDRSEEISIGIADPGEIERQLGQRQIALKEDVSATVDMQKEARRAVEMLRADAASSSPLDRTAVDRLRDAQILQGRVTRKTEEFQTGIERVLNGYVFNRLGGTVAGQAILRIYLRHLAADREELSRVFKPDLYEEIVESYRRGEIFDPEILGILVQIIEIGQQLSTEGSPRAHEFISAIVRGDAANPAAALRDVAEAQAACLARFESLMELMKRWETYHALVVRLQDIKSVQRSITEGARQALQEER